MLKQQTLRYVFSPHRYRYIHYLFSDEEAVVLANSGTETLVIEKFHHTAIGKITEVVSF